MSEDKDWLPHNSEAEIIWRYEQLCRTYSSQVSLALLIAMILRGIEKSLDNIVEGMPSQ